MGWYSLKLVSLFDTSVCSFELVWRWCYSQEINMVWCSLKVLVVPLFDQSVSSFGILFFKEQQTVRYSLNVMLIVCASHLRWCYSHGKHHGLDFVESSLIVSHKCTVTWLLLFSIYSKHTRNKLYFESIKICRWIFRYQGGPQKIRSFLGGPLIQWVFLNCVRSSSEGMQPYQEFSRDLLDRRMASPKNKSLVKYLKRLKRGYRYALFFTLVRTSTQCCKHHWAIRDTVHTVRVRRLPVVLRRLWGGVGAEPSSERQGAARAGPTKSSFAQIIFLCVINSV